MEADALIYDQQIARQLRVTWPVFFQRWGRLTPVQRQAIPSILKGENILISSATASGKTEAVCAPLIERYISIAQNWTLLYVCPTRALVNDLSARLEGPLAQIGISLQKRTGEYRNVSPGGRRLLITTPESFDSLLCRGRIDNGHELQDVCAVVLDEIHLLDGSARGYQLQVLLERLRQLKEYLAKEFIVQERCIQCVALSATVPDFNGVMERYLGGNSTLVSVPGRRRIDKIVVDEAETKKTEDALPTYLKAATTPEKVIVFAESRRRVEELSTTLASTLGPLGYEVRAHHGSLSKSVREQAEQDVHALARIVVVSTSTLEIGIDIGDIDLVVLDAPPPSVPSLLQRIGRGNRRTDTTRVMMCSRSLAEELVHAAMLEAAEEGYLGVSHETTHYAALTQQIASYIYQSPNRERSSERIDTLLTRVSRQSEGKIILEKMVAEAELVVRRPGKYSLGDVWIEKADRGHIHSNIESVSGATVIDATTGKPLATNVSYGGESNLLVGGRSYTVVGVDGYSLRVRSSDGPASAVRYFSGRFRYGAAWASAVRYFLRLSPDHWPIIRQGQKTFVLHLGGDRVKWVIELLRKRSGDRTSIDVTNTSMVFHDEPNPKKPQWMRNMPRRLDAQIADNIVQLETQLGLPKANRRLPEILRRKEVESVLNIVNTLHAIKISCWEIAPDLEECPEIVELLRTDS